MDAADRHRRNGTCLDPATVMTGAGRALYARSARGTTLNQAPVWTLARSTTDQFPEAFLRPASEAAA